MTKIPKVKKAKSVQHLFDLGWRLRDKVTGFSGIATNRLEYLNGCIQYCLKPKQDKPGDKMPEGEYVDQQQLEFVDEGIYIVQKDTGGYTDMPKKNKDLPR